MRQILSAWRTPEECFSDLWKRIPKHIRLSFAAAVALGLATHLYAFTNKLTNHDDLDQMFYAGYGAASGRWLLPSILRLDGDFSIPWLIGLIGILCLAGTVCLTVSLLRIRHPLGCVVTAAVMVSYPTVASTFAYMFTSSGYFFGLLLAVFGAYAAVRWGWPGSA
ncbi:MAG: glucosyltransferase domain-containing protein, partial [Oscillospiraceae bacterium]|nr:glucosyltransferase domain-containing protein [Oscillospiraceae bacterium]